MPIHTDRRDDPATRRDADPSPAELPDLFGNPTPSPAPPRRSKPSGDPAEWPAATSPTPRTTPPDRTPRRHVGSGVRDLSGTYDRAGQTLRRADGVALVVCLTQNGTRTSRDSARYIRLATPGGAHPPPYAGNLYPSHTPGRCDLDGCQFQHGRGGTRYRIATDGPGRYTVAPVKRRRRGASA